MAEKQVLGAESIPHDEFMRILDEVMKKNAEAMRMLAKL